VSEETNVEDKIFDSLGNELMVGNRVAMLPQESEFLIGTIKRIKPGEHLRLQKRVTPTQIQIIFDVTLQAPMQMKFMRGLVRCVTPQAEAAVKEAMDLADKTPDPPVQ